MDTRTGDMVDIKFIEKLREENPKIARFYKEIPEQFLPEISGFNRQQRREWYKKNKKRLKEAIRKLGPAGQ